MIKLVIGLPFGAKDADGCPRRVHPEWAMALATMQIPMNCTYARCMIKNKPRAEARTHLVETARQMGAEYLLFLDDDTVAPHDTVVRLLPLLDSDPTMAAAGGIYTCRGGLVNEPMVFMDVGSGPFWRWRKGDVFPCFALGTGCLMLRLSVFDTLPSPWFWDVATIDEARTEPGLVEHDQGGTFTMTDDIYLCRKLRRAGHRIVAHGGILPVHMDERGQPYVLDLESYPMTGVQPEELWYHQWVSVPPRRPALEMPDPEAECVS